MYLYVNGTIQDDKEIRISPYEHGFLYGAGLFETFRTYEGRPFLLTDHVHRLQEGAAELELELPETLERDIRGAIPQLLERNGLTDGYFRLNVSAGAEGVGLPQEPYRCPLVILYVKPLPESFAEEKEAVTLQLRRSSPEGEIRRKSHHYWNNILAKREVGKHAAEGIFLDAAGAVSESITSNLFFTDGHTLYTPDPSTGCLPGVTAGFIGHAARALGMRVEQGRYPLQQALRAEEAFLTNSIQEIVPLKRWDDTIFPGKRGPVARSLQRVYEQAAEKTKQQEEQGDKG
ncbi:aminodeoxychorismate lyase [Alkalicoccus luteus]|uniref:Aminodeoxychorismate lyase n=1 Tax=Alkalicoccus luteus TaxID=1237094 RepID=A0A969TV30_9BACI|nr:aminodeoxychorismate lyase [Alkalicoccus luteus]NJP39338.1 aminodeoxychorismate lyase [Alkalicoccus luteus]